MLFPANQTHIINGSLFENHCSLGFVADEAEYCTHALEMSFTQFGIASRDPEAGTFGSRQWKSGTT